MIPQQVVIILLDKVGNLSEIACTLIGRVISNKCESFIFD